MSKQKFGGNSAGIARLAGGFAILALLVGAAFVACDKDDDGGGGDGGGSGGVKFPDNFQGVWQHDSGNIHLKIEGGTLLSAIGSTPNWTSNTTTKFVLTKKDGDNYTLDKYYGDLKMAERTITATLTDGNLSITVNTIEASIPDATYTKQP